MVVEILNCSKLNKHRWRGEDYLLDLSNMVSIDTTGLWPFVYGRFQFERNKLIFEKRYSQGDLYLSQLLFFKYFLTQKTPSTLITTSANIIEAEKHNAPYFYRNLLLSLKLIKKPIYILDISHKDLPQQLKNTFYKYSRWGVGYGELMAYLSARWVGAKNYVSDDKRANQLLSREFHGGPEILTSTEYVRKIYSPQDTLKGMRIVLL